MAKDNATDAEHDGRQRKRNRTKRKQVNPILEAYLTNSNIKKKQSKSNTKQRNHKKENRRFRSLKHSKNDQETGSSERHAEEQSSYSAFNPEFCTVAVNRKSENANIENADPLVVMGVRHLSQLPEIELGYANKFPRGKSNSIDKYAFRIDKSANELISNDIKSNRRDEVDDYNPQHVSKMRKSSIQDISPINDNYMMIKNEYYSQENPRVSTPKQSKGKETFYSKVEKSISVSKRNSNIYLYDNS